MWKYITRNVRETFERRICSSLTDHSSGQDNTSSCKLKAKLITPINKFCKRNPCCRKYYRESRCEDNKQNTRSHSSWSDEYYRHTWLGAVGWSTALVLSWNLLQPLCRVQYLYEKDRKHPWKHYYAEYWKEHKSWKNNGKWGWQCEIFHVTDSPCYQYQTDGIRNSASISKSFIPILSNDGNNATYSKDTDYSGIWKFLAHTVWALPSYVVPRPVKITNDETDSQESEQFVKYGPATAEEALDEATRNLMVAQNSVMGDIDNRIGVELMQKGNHHEAVSHFSKAVSLRNACAAYNMGICYEMGLGINQDFKMAAKYYRLASDQGHASAMYNLGVFYVHGWGGLAMDCDKAQKFFQKASSLGQQEAKNALEMVQAQESSPIDESDYNSTSSGIVQQVLEIAQDLGLGLEDHSELQVLQVPQPAEYKDLSDLVHESILKYTTMLQK